VNVCRSFAAFLAYADQIGRRLVDLVKSWYKDLPFDLVESITHSPKDYHVIFVRLCTALTDILHQLHCAVLVHTSGQLPNLSDLTLQLLDLDILETHLLIILFLTSTDLATHELVIPLAIINLIFKVFQLFSAFFATFLFLLLFHFFDFLAYPFRLIWDNVFKEFLQNHQNGDAENEEPNLEVLMLLH
jgi:hypothetical protein